jgi:hypothetical protein
MKRGGLLVLLALMVAPIQGCDGASRRASARLRTENAGLLRQIDELKARTRELEAGLLAAEQEQHRFSGQLTAAPRLATITVSPMSGFEPGNSEDTKTLEVHVAATDGLNRPIQLVGPIEAQVLRPVPGAEPEVVASAILSPAEVRDAWRGGLFGTTYLVPIQLQTASLAKNKTLLVHVFHEDLTTGQRVEGTGGIATPELANQSSTPSP